MDELADIGAKLERRGRQLLRHRDRFHDHTVDDWIAAERALATQPVFGVTVSSGMLEIVAALADPNGGLQVDATADAIVIASVEPKPRGPRTYLSICMPQPIDPATVRAAFEEGLFVVHAAVRPATATHTQLTVRA